MIKRKFIAAVLSAILTFSSVSTNPMAAPIVTTGVETTVESLETTEKTETETSDFETTGEETYSQEETKQTSGTVFNLEDMNNGPIDFAPLIQEETEVDNEDNAPHIEASETKRGSELVDTEYELEDEVTIIIELEKDSLLDAGYSVSEISENHRAASSYARSQERQIETVTDRLEKTLEEGVDTLYEYKVAITGVAVSTQYKNLETIKEIEGVKDAWISPTYYLTDVETNTANASTIIGSDVVWNTTGYTGEGMKVAIIDTGIYVNHNSFQPLGNDKLTDASMTESDIESVWAKLNAGKYSSRPVGVYKNSKIPFAYNYVGHNTDVAHTASDHGTHVAGIAAANKIDTTDVVGVAPDAQLIVMQVFNPEGGADFADVLAAMEDGVYLDVDVMNLSLGSTSGFTDSEEAVNAICDKFSVTDIQVAIAAGNDTHNGLNNLYGYNLSLASNPDIGLVGTPGTYSEAMTVASLDNTATKSYTFRVDEKDIGYGDTALSSSTNWLSRLGLLKTYAYVWLGDGVYGASEEEFRNANNGTGVEGKIALVSRGGGVSFTDKQTNAMAAGAIACIVYNNASGSINMQINDGNGHIPCVSISKVDGAYMISKIVDGEGSLKTGNGQLQTIISDTMVMSDFSSWGVTPSLKLKPDITGVGGNIYSTRDNNNYGFMSGTSMATPQVAGATAIAMQYVRDKLAEGLTEQEIRDLTSALLMSTANPVMTGEIEYSPRLQGAGLINLIDTVSTVGYFTSALQEDGRPKVEMGGSKEGSFEVSFTVNNLSDQPIFYELDSSLSTEGVTTDGENFFMTSTPVQLDTKVDFRYDASLKYDLNNDGILNTADVRLLLKVLNGVEDQRKRPESCYDINGDGSLDKEDVHMFASYVAEFEAEFQAEDKILEVPASSSLDCTGQITLSENEKAYMDTYFENGIYVDGYIYAKSFNGDIENLSMPLLGFYGDWTEAPVFDEAFNYNYEVEGQASLYPITLFTDYYLLGVNPYTKTAFNEEHAAISKNNGFAEFDMGLLRNAKELTFSVTDAATDEVYWTITENDVAKTYYNSSYGMIVPYFIYNPQFGDKVLWDGTDLDGNYVADNTKVILKAEAKLDYEGEKQYQSFEIPVWVDNTKPVIENINNLQPVVENGTVNLTLSLNDNRYIACVLFVSPDGTIMGKQAVEGYKTGTTMDYTFDITGFGEDFTIIVADYACNELSTDVELDLGANADDNTFPLSKLDGERLYAFESNGDSENQQGWYSANKTDLSDIKNITYTGASRYYSAEYVDGYIYAQTTTGELVMISPRNSYWKENVLNTQSTVILYDMAFDYSTNTLYAVGWDYSIGEKGASVLCTVDLANGSINRVAALSGMMSDTMVTLACTTEGQLYGIDMKGYLYKIPELNNGHPEAVGKTSFANRSDFYGVNVIQSMAYDHNTDVVYWNAYSYKYDVNTNSQLRTYGVFTVDLETAETNEIGALKNNNGIGLFIPYEGGDIIPDNQKPTGVMASQYSHSMLPTQTKKLTLKWEPWNAIQSKVTWEIIEENPNNQGDKVISIDVRGKVTAIAPGTAQVTAKAMVYPEWNPEGYEETCTFEINVLESADDMYGFLLADLNDVANNQNTWITFQDAKPEAYDVLGVSEFSYYAAAYYNGYIYGVCLAGDKDDFYKLSVSKNGDDETTFGTPEYIGSMPVTNITDMTFDYTTGRMYAIENKQSFMYLSIIDLETGSLDRVSTIDDILVTLACDADGTLYGINTNGVLYTFDSETGEGTEVYDTGVEGSGLIQSMTYDYNTGNLYWAQCLGMGTSSLYLLNKNTDDYGWTDWETIKLGDIGGRKGAEISGLFTIPENEPEASYIPVTGIDMDQSDFSLLQGASYQLTATTTPKRPTLQKKNWSSSDESVLTVDSVGVVTAIKPGTVTVSVTITDRESQETYKDEINITVIASAGELKAFLNRDIQTSYYNWWISIPDYDPKNYSHGVSATDAFTLSAGEYYDGYIYAYNNEGNLYRIDEETKNYESIGGHNVSISAKFTVFDMTFDYDTFTMIALCGEGYGVSATALYEVNLTTGTMKRLVKTDKAIFGLAYGNGNLYGVKGDGTICTIDRTSGSLSDVMATGNGVNKINNGFNTTLAYDHNTDRLYMAPIKNNDPYNAGDLYMIDPNAKVCMSLGKIGTSGALVSSMYIVPKEGSVPVDTRVSGITLNKDVMRLEVGNTGELKAKVMPTTAVQKDISWLSSNPSVASIEDGVVKAIGTGTATITATTVEGGFVGTCTVTVLDPANTSGDSGYAFSTEYGGLIKFNPELPATTVELVAPFDKADKVLASTCVDNVMYYVIDVPNYYPKLFKMDLTSYNTTEIGYIPMQVGPANDMTYDPFTELLYIASGFYIYVADPITGSVITSVNINNNQTHAITASNGYIYLAANDGYNKSALYELDTDVILKASYGATLVPKTNYKTVGALNPQIPTTTASKMEIDLSSNSVYITAGGFLYRVNTSTAKVEKIDSIATIGGLAFQTPPDWSPIMHVMGVELNKTEMKLRTGMTKQLIAAVYPDKNKVNKNVSWTSDNETVVKVDENGMITALAAGSGTVTVTTEDGGYTATCAITVVESGSEKWMYGYSASEKAFVRFDLTMPDVEGEILLSYDAGVDEFGEQIYPGGTSYVNGYVYFVHKNVMHGSNLYRWKVADNSVEIVENNLTSVEGYNISVNEVTSYGERLYIMTTNGLYTYDINSKEFSKLVAKDYYSACGLAIIDENTIFGQTSGGRQLLYEKTDGGWKVTWSSSYNPIRVDNDLYCGAINYNDNLYFVNGTELYLINYSNYQATKIGTTFGNMTALFLIPEEGSGIKEDASANQNETVHETQEDITSINETVVEDVRSETMAAEEVREESVEVGSVEIDAEEISTASSSEWKMD